MMWSEQVVCTSEASVYTWDDGWVRHGDEVNRIDVYFHPMAQTHRVVATADNEDPLEPCLLSIVVHLLPFVVIDLACAGSS